MSNTDAGLEVPLYPEKGIVQSVLMPLIGEEITSNLLLRCERDLQALLPKGNTASVSYDCWIGMRILISTPSGMRRYCWGGYNQIYREDEDIPPYFSPPVGKEKRTFCQWLLGK